MLEPGARRAQRHAVSAFAFVASGLVAAALARGEPARSAARHLPPSLVATARAAGEGGAGTRPPAMQASPRAAVGGVASRAAAGSPNVLAAGPGAAVPGAPAPGARARAVASPLASAGGESEQLETVAGATVHVVSPRGTVPAAGAATFLFLHGMCSIPTRPCAYWEQAGTAGTFLACPVGNGHCGGLADWEGSGEDKAAHLDAARAAVRARFGDQVRADGEDVLVGFSRGAFVARDVIYARQGVWRGVVLIGARFQPDARRFLDAGVRRVVLAAGDYDEAAPTMKRAAAELTAAGLPARFASLGRIGHLLPAEVGSLLSRELAWVRDRP